MNKHAVLFGLNYSKDPNAKLRGCINDVINTESILKEKGFNVERYTDDDNDPRKYATTGRGILSALDKLAWQTYVKKIDFIWIHFSGHGTSIRDTSHDERDGLDECFVPSDYKRVGVISDDTFKKIFRKFNARTRIFCVFDCCHSGTIGDLKYRYLNSNVTMNRLNPVTENYSAPCKANIVVMSGCSDDQTSADAFNVQRLGKFTGAMTSCLLTGIKKYKNLEIINIFDLLNDVRKLLRDKQFSQYPQLTSSFVFDFDKQFYFKL